MSRQIKFRAWNKQDKIMMVIFDSADQTEWFLPNLKDKFEVMQFTGLKDRNGIEIFEGDILKITCNFEFRKGIEIDKVVWWDEGAWCCCDWCLFELVSNAAKGEQEFEVIGNIYKNPELL